MRTSFFALLGLGFLLAGTEKLVGARPYERLFRHFGWTPRAMRWVGFAEALGGALVASRGTRRLGGAVLAGTSATVLNTELKHRDTALAVPRLALLVAALGAVLAGDD